MNLYAYAGNNPISFSDPFGLCKPWPDCLLQAAADWGAQRGGSLGSVVLNGAAALNAAAEASGVNDLSRAVADGSAVGVGVALAGILPVGKVAKIGKLVDGMHLQVDDALDAAVDFLGKGYKEAAKGRFVSSDGLRQVRMGTGDVTGAHGKGPHMNFETKTPDPSRPGSYTHDNKHIYLDGQ